MISTILIMLIFLPKDKLKNYYLMFSDSGKPEKYIDMRQANPDADKLMAEFISSFGEWGEIVRKDFFKCVQSFTTKVLSELDTKPIEDLAELAQNCYNLYNDRLNNNVVYQGVTSEVRDELLDFFEKHSMVSLYRLVIFICSFTYLYTVNPFFITLKNTTFC